MFSYFLSEETTENNANEEPDPHPYSPPQDQNSPISSTSEKSFFDVIRDGLNYIDSNDEHVEKILYPSGINATTATDRPLQKNTTELSFLEILLSDDDDDDDDENSEVIEEPFLHHETFPNYGVVTNYSRPADNSTFYVSAISDDELNRDRYALLDEQSTPETTVPTFTVNSVKHSESTPPVKTSSYDRSATERIISEYIVYTSVPNYETSTLSTNQDFDMSTIRETTTQDQESFTSRQPDEGNSTGWSTVYPTQEQDIFSERTTTEMEELTKLQTTTSASYYETGESTTTEPSVVSTFFEEFSHLFVDKNSLKETDAVDGEPQTTQEQTSTLRSEAQVSTQSPSIPKTTRRVNPTIVSSQKPLIVTVTPPTIVSSQKPLIVTVTLPTRKRTTTSSAPPSKSPTIVRLHTSTTTKTRSTTTTIPVTTPPSTTSSQPSNQTVASPKVNVQPTHSTGANPPTTKIFLTTTSPPLIDSNPSILDSDINYDYGDQPTLPPSLPNLKIIPFLPTDAVRKDNVNVHPKVEYYSTISTSYPVLTENYENSYLTGDNSQTQNADFTSFEVDESEAKDTFNRNNDNPDFNSYSVESTAYSNDGIFGLSNTNGKSPEYNQYPSITETPNVEQAIVNKYPAYNVDYDYESFNSEKHLDTNKYAPGSYEVLDGHKYSVQGRNPSFDKFATEYPERRVYSKIEFSTSNPLYGYNGNNKFSPPSKTEGTKELFFVYSSNQSNHFFSSILGGFLPKEHLDDDQYYDKAHTTKHLSDVTTDSSPKANVNSTELLIGNLIFDLNCTVNRPIMRNPS